jgi:hypothetical protein
MTDLLSGAAVPAAASTSAAASAIAAAGLLLPHLERGRRISAYGLFHEIISWKLRMFVPVGGNGPSVLAKLFDRYPLVRVADREAA